MPQNKLPSSINTQELIDLIVNEKFDNTSLFEVIDDPIKFVTFCNLTEGENKIPRKLLYKFYSDWSISPKSQREFVKSLNRFFELKEDKYYLLNKNAFELLKDVEKFLKARSRYVRSRRLKWRFDNFLKAHDLKPGTIWVETPILYYLYDKYAYKLKYKSTLTYQAFAQMSRLYFKTKRLTESRILWFGVSETLFNHITPEELAEVRKGYKSAAKRHKEKTKPKI